jgi:DNA polymerase-3 subunit beta
VLSTVLVQGSFPKYEDVIPKEHTKRARVDCDVLFGAVKRAALLATEESGAVKLAFDKESLVITSQAPEQGDARVEIPISYEGEPLAIGFNPVFLNDALRVVPFDEVLLDLDEAFRPGVLCGEDKSEFIYVIMPVSLST